MYRLVVRYILTKIGAQNPVKNDGSTPLHCAAINGDTKIIQLLYTYGKASAYSRDQNGDTPIHHAASQGHAKALSTLMSKTKSDRKHLKNSRSGFCFGAFQDIFCLFLTLVVF